MKSQQQQRHYIGAAPHHNVPRHNPQFSGVPTRVGGPVHGGRMHIGTLVAYGLFFYGGFVLGKGGLKKVFK